MINKSFKIIHNKYFRFFEFIFFLRYLFAIFFISLTLFFIIPKFFNYEKRAQYLFDHLFKNYNYNIQEYEKIEFEILPLPKIKLKNVKLNFKSTSITLHVKNLKIYPKLISIYDYKNFLSNKVILKDNNINLKFIDVGMFTKHFLNQKKKLSLRNLNLKIVNKDKSLLMIENIKFKNYGYNKNLIQGKVFDKSFKVEINNNFEKISFKLLNTGIDSELNFKKNKERNLIIGTLKSKILNTNIKFDFEYDKKILKIYNSYLRSKNISFTNESVIVFDPFLYIFSEIDIDEINTLIFKKIDLDKLLKSKNILKKFNIENKINFSSKKFNQTLIDKLNLKLDLGYGRLDYLKKFSISDNLFDCKGNINLLEEYPILNFNCDINFNDKKKFLRSFNIKSKDQNDIFTLNLEGNLSILNNKINLNKIQSSNNYIASKEDLSYFKNTFENIVYNESFLKIFNYKKIKEFLFEIS